MIGLKNSHSSPSNSILLNDRLLGRRSVHGTSLPVRVDKGIEPDLGQNARALRRRFPVHVEENAGGNIVGRDLIIADHLPDQWRLGASTGRTDRSRR